VLRSWYIVAGKVMYFVHSRLDFKILNTFSLLSYFCCFVTITGCLSHSVQHRLLGQESLAHGVRRRGEVGRCVGNALSFGDGQGNYLSAMQRSG
jgi:hypothetical protein